jgi:hypothetical protein
MAVTNKMINTLRLRDFHCAHCGSSDTLVPHHRRNRAMGGSKLLDRFDNLMLVCAEYNGMMESDADTARQARDYGHKLGSWDDFSSPVFDIVDSVWYELDNKGGKGVTEPPSYLI